MFARVTTFQIRPDKIDENNQVAESIIPAIKQQAGFKSFIALEDRSSGKAILVTIFETEADMKAGVNNGFVQQQVAKIAPYLTATPTSEFFEVAFHE